MHLSPWFRSYSLFADKTLFHTSTLHPIRLLLPSSPPCTIALLHSTLFSLHLSPLFPLPLVLSPFVSLVHRPKLSTFSATIIKKENWEVNWKINRGFIDPLSLSSDSLPQKSARGKKSRGKSGNYIEFSEKRKSLLFIQVDFSTHLDLELSVLIEYFLIQCPPFFLEECSAPSSYFGMAGTCVRASEACHIESGNAWHDAPSKGIYSFIQRHHLWAHWKKRETHCSWNERTRKRQREQLQDWIGFASKWMQCHMKGCGRWKVECNKVLFDALISNLLLVEARAIVRRQRRYSKNGTPQTCFSLWHLQLRLPFHDFFQFQVFNLHPLNSVSLFPPTLRSTLAKRIVACM